MSLIIDQLFAHASAIPDRIALIGNTLNQGKRQALSYMQLCLAVQGRIDELNRLDADCIALRADNSIDWVITDLAALALDIPLLPVPMFFTPTQVRHALMQSGANHLLGNWDDLPDLYADFNQRTAEKNSEFSLFPGTVKVTFTSGSTGHPKGVCLDTRVIEAVSQKLSEVVSEGISIERHLVMLPLSTLLENITGIYVPLLLGRTAVVLKGSDVGLIGSSGFDGQKFAAALCEFKPHSLVLTPALLQALLQLAIHNPRVTDPLRFVAVGGARVPPTLLTQAERLGLPIFEGYGLSECGSVVAVNRPGQTRPGSCGQVLPHLKVRISERGEIMVRGQMALGYIGQPFTEEWLPTGDLGEFDDAGFLHIRGRCKNVLVTSFGRNVSPEWVEAEAHTFKALRSLVVFGDGQTRLTALVIYPQREAVIDALDRLNQRLPDYARIGDLVWLSQPPATPLFTPNSRLMRTAIEQFASRCERQPLAPPVEIVEA